MYQHRLVMRKTLAIFSEPQPSLSLLGIRQNRNAFMIRLRGLRSSRKQTVWKRFVSWKSKFVSHWTTHPIQLTFWVVQLKSQLFEKEQALWHFIPKNRLKLPSKLSPASQTFLDPSRPVISASGITLPRGSMTTINSITSNGSLRQVHSDSRSPGLDNTSNPFRELFFSGWNPDLPNPDTLNH